jgi:predicted AAA+ superfamily ATPase
MMKPWREIAIPRPDVLKGTFQQAEFAADITAVKDGKAPREYQDACAFFEQTFITEGMRRLLTQVAQRLAGKGGEPVIQLQTAFGGGKTHTMLAVWHLATRKSELKDLAGIPDLIDAAGLMDLPQARVAVIDGNAHAPGQAWKHGKTSINTLWGELAWQLGGSEGYALVKESDAAGTSPGKEILQELLAAYAPCVVLIDELVAYVRQFEEGKRYTGGSYDSNLSFIQALTEAAKMVPNAIILASLPESEVEAGSQRGVGALKALEKTFGRVQALWKPVATEEAFEIVRRRLFTPIKEHEAVRKTCRAFADAYIAEGTQLPAETQEGRYFDRLAEAYPIHPEIFDRLYEDWTTIDGFQRTRGVLKLMAKVIYRLWEDDNRDLLIMPGSLPLADSSSRNELTYYLPPGWDPVLDSDIDGPRAETTDLENRETRFGQINAARRVARTLFLGSAPSSVAGKGGVRGQDRAHILLGCLQPGQSAAVYSDALNKLADRLHYLSSSGDKAQNNTRFWFDTRANLRREMEDRKRRFDDKAEVRAKIKGALEKAIGRVSFIEGVHVFTDHADVPDDQALRLVVLPTDAWHNREESRESGAAVNAFLKNNGSRPRLRPNRLLFLAADQSTVSRLVEAARVALAWGSIVEDIRTSRLNIDLLQKTQAETEQRGAEDILPRIARECYRWLLCPSQEDGAEKPSIEAFAVNTSGNTLAAELERSCADNELVITTWSPIHLRDNLKALYWKADKAAVLAASFWEDSLRYIYLPRLKNREVLGNAIRQGAASRDFFGTAYGLRGDEYEGFQLGNGMAQFDDTLLLIEPAAAAAYHTKISKPNPATPFADPQPTGEATGVKDGGGGIYRPVDPGSSSGNGVVTPPNGGGAPARKRKFFGTVELPAATAIMNFGELHKEIIRHLTKDPTASVKLTLEIAAEFENGAPEDIRRTVAENAAALKLKAGEWE